MAEDRSELVVADAADESGPPSQLSDPHHGVGNGATGGFESWTTRFVEGLRLLLIDQGHAAFLQAMGVQEAVVGLNQHVNDGVADSHHVKAAGAGEAGVGSHGEAVEGPQYGLPS